MNIYFDNAATTKPSENVVKAITDTMLNFYANSDSLHKLGMAAEDKIIHSKKYKCF